MKNLIRKRSSSSLQGQQQKRQSPTASPARESLVSKNNCLIRHPNVIFRSHMLRSLSVLNFLKNNLKTKKLMDAVTSIS